MLDDVIKAARDWLADCGAENAENSAIFSDPTIALMVHYNYIGGWEAFMASDPDLNVQAVWDEMDRRWPVGLVEQLSLPSPSQTR